MEAVGGNRSLLDLGVGGWLASWRSPLEVCLAGVMCLGGQVDVMSELAGPV